MFGESWKITALAPRPTIEAALLAHEDAWDWDPEIILSGSEIAEDKPEDWQLEAWMSRKPSKVDRAAIAGQTGSAMATATATPRDGSPVENCG